MGSGNPIWTKTSILPLLHLEIKSFYKVWLGKVFIHCSKLILVNIAKTTLFILSSHSQSFSTFIIWKLIWKICILFIINRNAYSFSKFFVHCCQINVNFVSLCKMLEQFIDNQNKSCWFYNKFRHIPLHYNFYFKLFLHSVTRWA